jgi:hypothetical protein
MTGLHEVTHTTIFIGILRFLQNGIGIFIAIMLQDKLRQNIKDLGCNYKCDVKYTFKLKQIDVLKLGACKIF